MRHVSQANAKNRMSGIRWAWVLPAGVAVHVVGVVVTVLLVTIYSVFTVGGSVSGFAGPLFTWTLPILTLPTAAWVARGARREAAVLNGLLLGLIVAGTLGLLFFWPHDLHSIALFATIIVAGFAGGLLGGYEVRTGAR